MAGEWHITTIEKAPLEIIDGDRGANYPNQTEFSTGGHCLFLNAGNVTTAGFRDINRIEIPIPPPPEQRAIAHILGTLDDKIELNRRTNETLEAMARALFQSWFVDFDPVRAKAAGRDPGLPKPLADLFPTRLVDSELGEIPEGWEVKNLDEIARFLNGLALQNYPASDGRSLPVIKIAQLRARNTQGADRASADIDPDYIIEDGDILFSWSGSLECVLWAGGKGALNQHLFKVTSDRYPKWLCYLGIHHHLDDFRHIAAGKATTMGDVKDPLRMVLVRDMWLTGFDAPSLHTMYVDKPMRGHGLMQAIARVNRVFRDKPSCFRNSGSPKRRDPRAGSQPASERRPFR
jgi:hypothetical protein